MDKKDSFANRLRAVRSFLRISRQEFANRHGIPEITLKYWELSKSHISDSQLHKLLNAFAKEGIYCTKEWLLTGEGSSPFSSNNTDNLAKIGIESEIEHFLKHNKNAIIQTITEDTLNPLYNKDDIVGGIEIDLNKNILFSPFPAIVYLETLAQQSIYYVIQSQNNNILLSTGINITSSYSLIEQPIIRKIYKIVWHRKPN